MQVGLLGPLLVVYDKFDIANSCLFVLYTIFFVAQTVAA